MGQDLVDPRGTAMRPIYVPILAAIWLCPGIAAAAMAIPDCAGRVVVARQTVTRVERNGGLILDRGRAVVLEGIRLPLGDGTPPLLADEVLVALTRLASGPITFATTPPERDRYDRLRAQAFASVWLQRALLERGLARVEIAPDRTGCASGLYDAESAARRAGLGLWALPAYRVRAADLGLNADIGTFQVVEGIVANIGSGDGRSFIDFSIDWRRGFSAVIAGDDRKTFRRMGFDLAALRGRRIRLRGMVEDANGRPQIALANPAQIEMLH